MARAETRARILQIGWYFAPPEGWTYVQGGEVTVASGKNGALVVTARKKESDKKERDARDEMLRALAEKIGVTLPKKKNLIAKKADQTEKVGDLSMELFQIDGAKREAKKGPLLVFVADLPEGQTLVGAGFVSDDDQDNSDRAIMDSIHSVSRAGSSAAPDSKKAP